MHILVTGGTGFIGKALCAELLRRGHQPTVLTRSIAQATVWLPTGVRVIADLAALREDMPEAIINLAGENLGNTRWNAERKQRFLDSRVHSTRALVDLMRGALAKPRVLVSGSAIGWYGARGDEILGEDARSGRDDEFQVQLCRAWEAEALQAETLGVRVCRVRIGVVLEKDGGPLAKMLPPFRLGLGGPLGDGRQWMSWIHRADLIALLIRLCEDDALSGVFNGTTPFPVRNRDFAVTLGKILKRPAVLPMPAFALRSLAGEMSELLLTGQRVVPQRTLSPAFGYRHADLASALQNILRAPLES